MATFTDFENKPIAIVQSPPFPFRWYSSQRWFVHIQWFVWVVKRGDLSNLSIPTTIFTWPQRPHLRNYLKYFTSSLFLNLVYASKTTSANNCDTVCISHTYINRPSCMNQQVPYRPSSIFIRNILFSISFYF